ncbi:MAG: hypothetical protein E6Q34_03075 [Burkholderiaceae bacterium]|nr:MAG: hypothetical protein E6Q34_03075 [Burkholderiaceae bacterium]
MENDDSSVVNIGPVHIGACNVAASIVGLVYFHDLVLIVATVLMCGFLLALAFKQADSDYLLLASGTVLPIFVCSVIYLVVTDSKTLELEFDGSPMRYESTLRSYLFPKRFYLGQLEFIDANIAKLKKDHVPGWLYVKQREENSSEFRNMINVLGKRAAQEVAAENEKRLKEALSSGKSGSGNRIERPVLTPSEMQANALDDEANRLKGIAERIRYEEWLKNSAADHDKIYLEELAKYDSLRLLVNERLRKL